MYILSSSRDRAVAQVRIENAIVGTPAHLFESLGEVFFQLIGTNGSIVARMASFVFFKKNGETPDFFSDPSILFPCEEGLHTFADGTLMFAMLFYRDGFDAEALSKKVKYGLAEMRAEAGDDWK